MYLQPSSVQESAVSPRGKTTIHFVTSLFPNVPPFLSFSTHTDKRPPMSPYLYKVLKWKLTNVMPKLIRRVLISSGFRLLKSILVTFKYGETLHIWLTETNDWMGIWSKHMKSTSFKTVRSYQKFNHIPGSFKIGRKDSCWRNLQAQMIKHGNKEFGFMPKWEILSYFFNNEQYIHLFKNEQYIQTYFIKLQDLYNPTRFESIEKVLAKIFATQL